MNNSGSAYFRKICMICFFGRVILFRLRVTVAFWMLKNSKYLKHGKNIFTRPFFTVNPGNTNLHWHNCSFRIRIHPLQSCNGSLHWCICKFHKCIHDLHSSNVVFSCTLMFYTDTSACYSQVFTTYTHVFLFYIASNVFYIGRNWFYFISLQVDIDVMSPYI